jgi:hypothetical protein
MKKVIVYFTDSRLEEGLDEAVRKQILKAANGIPIISVTQKPIDFGKNICVGMRPRNYLNLYRQLLTGIKATEKDSIVFTCEHDVFYHPSHFDFTPPRNEKIYFNLNRFYWMRNQDFFLSTIGKRALSQGCGHRNVFLAHAKEQVTTRETGMAAPCIGPFMNFESKCPNIDIRHGGNFSIFGTFDESHLSRRIPSVEYWGTPRRFQEKVGYYNYNADAGKVNEVLNPENKSSPVEVEFLRGTLPGMFHSLGFNKGAEIGVKYGLYSKEICENIPDVDLKSIDPYIPDPKVHWDEMERRFIVAKKTLDPFGITIIKKTSVQAADEDVPIGSLDFVYIDADHSFNSVMQDIILWSDRVRPFGIVSGHDYDNEEVKLAVDTYTKVHDYGLFVTQKSDKYPDSSPSWFFVKEV